MTNNALILLVATAIHVEHDTISIYQPNDTPIERLTFELNTHPVQIIRYDGDNESVAVAIDGYLGSMEIMPAVDVAEYLLAHC